MFPRVIKAGAGPHDLGSGDNHDETFPELTVELRPDSDTGSDSSGNSTGYSSSVTSYDSGLELFHNVSSVRLSPSPRLSVLTPPFRRRRETASVPLQNGSSR